MSSANDFYLVDLQFKNDLASSSSRDLQRISGKNNAIQALFNRLVTVPGSLAHRPTYGVGVKQWQNRISTLGAKRDLALRIKSQFEEDFRVDKFLGVQFTEKENGKFFIKYRLNLKGIGEITATVNPFGDIEI
jgi:hypothetical protein